MITYQYRVAVGDNDDYAVDYGETFATEAEARADLEDRMGPDYCDPAYEIGWVERKPVPAVPEWEQVGPTVFLPAPEAAA